MKLSPKNENYYGMKPDVINNTQMAVNGRAISADVSGYLSNKLESMYEGATALYLMGDAADQIPQKTADYWRAGADGKAERVQLSVQEGLAFVKDLGDKMTTSALGIINKIDCRDSSPNISLTPTSFSWPLKNGTMGNVDVEIMRIGADLTLVGLKPEINALTGLALRNGSPFKNTVAVSFLNGDQKYLPDAQAYLDNTREISRTDFSAGAAEKFLETVFDILNDMK
ncbi:MAG TPA: hypothetical protein GXZ52_03720 [Clostridiales bacterium]|nr:hypothetical protein [Clostridiales bacterium]